MSLSVGIVGLPNVGKSTLFNALLKKQQAYVANFPFATIEPNIGVVPVPDSRLEKLAQVIANSTSEESKATSEVPGRPPIVPATVEFVDIAGLVKDAHKGEGLGNKFLSHIREVDAICHVVRAFSDPNIIKEGSADPKSDFETVKTELELTDLEMIERQKDKKGNVDPNLPLFSKKPILVVLNIDESEVKNADNPEKQFANDASLSTDQVVAICAKVEEELANLSEEEGREYLKTLGVEKISLERLIKKMYTTLNLVSFLTAGIKEVRAWTIKKGTNALKASGVIHTDFMDKFIKAEVVNFEDFIELGGWQKSREKGKTRLEGKDYIVQDGDVVEFKIGS